MAAGVEWEHDVSSVTEPAAVRAPARFAAMVAAVALLAAVLRVGWASDDAFISIRSVDHLVHGKGFVLNVDQRVQSFTSPLWALFCVPFLALTSDPYWSLVAPGLVCTVALTVVVLLAFREQEWKAAVTLLALCASLAFLHFSTSGLENSLSHLLAALFTLERLGSGGKATRRGFALAAGLFLTRFDYALLVAPAVLLAIFIDRKGALRLAWPGLSAACAWLLFATIYYGFPLPNTAYAKLNTIIPFGDRVSQGLTYLLNSLERDPIVFVAIGAATLLALRRRTPAVVRALVLGVLVYVLYVVDVGGDFMSGRFFTTCYVTSVLLIAEMAAPLHVWALPATAAALVPFLQVRTDLSITPQSVPESGIVNEWAFYAGDTGIAVNIHGRRWMRHGYLEEFRKASRNAGRFMEFNTAGIAMYANTAERHIVERYALTEPLLARIRFLPQGNWRIGHFIRDMPRGYMDSLRGGKNVIPDPCVHDLYDRLRLVTQGPIWSLPRLKAMWALNTTHAVCNPP